MLLSRTCLTRISGTIAIGAACITSWMLMPALAVIPEAIAPYFGLIVIILFARARHESAWVALAGTLMVSIVGLYILIDAFFVHPDPQSGLAALVTPWLQWIGCGITAIACFFIVFLKWLVCPARNQAL